jgi:hypothetical protein
MEEIRIQLAKRDEEVTGLERAAAGAQQEIDGLKATLLSAAEEQTRTEKSYEKLLLKLTAMMEEDYVENGRSR